MPRHSVRWCTLFLLFTLLCLSLSPTVARANAAAADEQSAADLAAEEAAAAAVGEAAEEEEDDDADAMDEEADSARFDSDRHPLSDMPPPADDVLVAHTFTKCLNATETLVLGDTCKTLVAFANSGRGQYHVWGVMGSINMEHKFAIHVQNFTYGVVNKTVPSAGELSFSYEFTPNERLDTRAFQLALSVFYEARGSSGNAIRGHSTTFYNATVATEPGPQTMSNATFMAVFVVAIAAAAGAVYVLRTTEAKKEPIEMGTADSSRNEWLEEHQAMVKTGGGRARSKNAGKKQ